VEITTFDSDAEAISKLGSGAIKADLHHSAATSTVYKLIDKGLVRKLNKSYIPNLANIAAGLADPVYDKGRQYTVPYTIFATGIGYRADRVDAGQVEEQGWSLVWNPEYKGAVSILDDDREALTLAMLRKGIKDGNITDQATIDQALADLTELIDLVNVKVNIEGYKDVPEGLTTVAHTWSADMINAQYYLPEGTGTDVLGFWYPADDVGVVNHDVMCVLSDAEHPVLAHLYMDYITDRTNAETNFSWLGYLPAIDGLDADYLIGQGYVPENLRRAVVTNDMITKGLQMTQISSEAEIAYEEAWSKFNAGG
jgi:spermidine/putrescine transport system substrate-binding protein